MSVPNRGPELFAVNVAFISLAGISYLLRCFVRLKMVKAFGLDDWLMGLALLFFLFYTISSNVGIHYGTGRHHHDLPQEGVERAKHCWWFCYIFYAWAMIFAKFSIGFLYLRISFKRIHTWIIYAAMCTSVVAGTTFFFVIVFQCNPVSYFWQRRTQDGTCISNGAIVTLGYIYSIFSILSDFTFAIIPGFLVWELQLKRKAKIALVPLIAMGCIASAAVIARLPYVRYFNSPDFLWATVDIAVWSTIEQGLAISAGSLATLRPLFFLVMNRLGLSTQRSGRRPSNYGGASGQRFGPSASASAGGHRSEKLRPDAYTLSNIVETRQSDDSGPKDKDIPKSPNWFNNSFPPPPPTKDSKPAKESKRITKKIPGDNESEKSLKMKSLISRTSDEVEDGMHIMVSKSFYVTDEERSMASRSGPRP